MVVNATVFQVANIRAEATPGTDPGTGTKRLQSIGLELNPKATINKFRAQGSKLSAVHALGREWSELAVTGAATYTELIYLLAGILRKDTSAPVDVGSDANAWVFDINNTGPDDIQTYTVEHGSSVRAHKSTNCFMSEFGLTWTSETVETTGTMMARAIQDAITLTADPDLLPLVPVLPTQTQIFVSDTQAGLAGASAITRGFRAAFTVSNRQGMFWPINSAVSSFGGNVELVPTVQLKLLMETNAAGMAFLPLMRAGTTYFARVKSIGPVIDSPDTNLLQLDFSGKLDEPSNFSDEDGVYAIEWTFDAVEDETWGKALEVLVQNELATL